MGTRIFTVKQDVERTWYIDRKWCVFDSDDERPLTAFDAKHHALDHALRVARAGQAAEVQVIGADGEMESRHLFAPRAVG